MDESLNQSLIMQVSQGNPGAITICLMMMRSAKWEKLLKYLWRNRIIGSALWELYKDVHGEDCFTLIEDLENRMLKEEQDAEI